MGTAAELPISLSQLPLLTYIDTEGTQIIESDCNAILLACRARRNERGQLGLQERLTLWKGFGNCTVDLKEFEKLTTSEANTLNEWLLRLERTRDFKGYQKELVNIVWEILKSLNVDSNFKETFFVQTEVNNEDCGDRASMAFNEIFTAWMIHTRSKEKMTFKEQLSFISKAAKTLALRRIIGQKIAKHQIENKNIERESVEIYLYYETLLREKLGLLTSIKRMSYEVLGNRSWIKPEDLIKEVNDTYLDDLIDLPIFKKLIEKDEPLLKLWNDSDKKYSDKMELLSEELPTADEFSEEMLEWKTKMNVLEQERDNKKNNITKEWVKKFRSSR